MEWPRDQPIPPWEAAGEGREGNEGSCNIPNFRVSRVNYLNLQVMSLRGYLRKDKEFRELK
jgi:hypothetical protein